MDFNQYSENQITNSRTYNPVLNALLSKVFLWMTVALGITGLTAMLVARNPAMLSPGIMFGAIILELILVFTLSAAINKLSFMTATMLFIAYSVLNGVTMSVIFLVYTKQSIALTFFVTAGMFAAMAIWGYITKKDLSKMGSILFMALIGIIIASLVNIFLKSEGVYWIITYAGVIVFAGLTAWDMQKIRHLLLMAPEVNDSSRKMALLGSLSLYLDFINLFIMLLRIFGRRD